jgi:hypothetical protein
MSYPVYFSEKNIRGAWVVYGALGVKQYYGYTKAEAEQLYKAECNKLLFVNQKGGC